MHHRQAASRVLSLLEKTIYDNSESNFMNSRTKIKVVKKDEVKTVETPVVPETESDENKASKLASTVSNWIDEFQQRRREETASAIEQFYP
jgi:hypothetical protein